MGFHGNAAKRPAWRGVALFLAAALAGACAEKPDPPASDAPAPPFELLDLDGRTHRLSDFAGQVVVLNFWATWCPPCVEEMPSLQRLQDLLGDDGREVVAVSVDERYSDIPPFVAEHGLRFLVLHDLGKRVSAATRCFSFPRPGSSAATGRSPPTSSGPGTGRRPDRSRSSGTCSNKR